MGEWQRVIGWHPAPYSFDAPLIRSLPLFNG
jgi:hypothetical protein